MNTLPPPLQAAIIACIIGSNAVAADPLTNPNLYHDSLLRPSAIVAGRYVAPDGTLLANAAIVLEDGKIKEVVPAENLEMTAGVVRRPDGVLSPGLIDVLSSAGAYGKVHESALAVDPGVSAIDALDPRHADFRKAVEAGVTTVVLAPAPINLVCGTGAVVKTDMGRGASVLRDDGPLFLALGPSVWQPDREPTSRMGSVAMLRQVVAEAGSGRGHRRLQEFVAGELNGIVLCGELPDLSAAIRTMGAGQARFAVAYNGDGLGVVEDLAGTGIPVILGSFAFESTRRALSLPAALTSADVPVALAGNLPAASRKALRLSAALAVRYGMDAAKARQAITATPAAVAGVADRVGAIRSGLDADLVVFSDDPLRPDAAVLEVYINGVRVFADADQVQALAGDPQ